jgi:hypothetical protein
LRLYKYKALSGDGLLHALDMIVEKRIYLSTYESMNDPHEGGFSVNAACFVGSKRIRRISEHDRKTAFELIKSTRFTCFTTTATEPLLWAHYANGYSGVCFEYEIPPKSSDFDLIPISYQGVSPEINRPIIQGLIGGVNNPYDHGMLVSKRNEWSYEKEYRLFSRSPAIVYYQNIQPKRVILGSRNNRCSAVFERICQRFEVSVCHLMADSSAGRYRIQESSVPRDETSSKKIIRKTETST